MDKRRYQQWFFHRLNNKIAIKPGNYLPVLSNLQKMRYTTLVFAITLAK